MSDRRSHAIVIGASMAGLSMAKALSGAFERVSRCSTATSSPRISAIARHDPALSVKFGRVSSLLDPPAQLLHPATVARVIRGNLLRGSLRRPAGQPPPRASANT
jgi:hypothetical protein